MSGFEIIDAQIHEPRIPDETSDAATRSSIAVEVAREAMDCVGVDAAIVVASPAYIAACIGRYPARFAGVHTIDPGAEGWREKIATLRASPGHLAARALIADFRDASLKAEFKAGAFNPLFAACERHETPVFISTHGWAEAVADVAQHYPELTIIVDHVGVSQSPVSPPRDDPWDRLPGLLGLAGFPNVHVKICGVPLLSAQSYPFDDVWPQLMRVIDAFGPRRLMWASDYTRLRMSPKSRHGVTYSECRDFLLYTDRLSTSEKAEIFGAAARRALRWPAEEGRVR